MEKGIAVFKRMLREAKKRAAARQFRLLEADRIILCPFSGRERAAKSGVESELNGHGALTQVYGFTDDGYGVFFQ